MHSAAFLLVAALKATIVFAAAFLLALALRRASASARYFLWTSALAVVLAIPLLSVSVRPWPIQVPAPIAAPVISETQIETPATGAPPTMPVSPARWPIALWLCGAAIVLARVLVGHTRVRRMMRRAVVVRDKTWIADLAEACARLHLRSTVEVRLSRDTDVPLSYGPFRPVILVPAAARDWDQERRNVVLLHELTHIRRRDWLVCLVSQAACAFYWFHPLAWLAAARFREEQERSCDDAVVIAGAGQSAYAEHLVALAGSITARSSWPAAIGMAESRGLEQRVRALLESGRKRRLLDGRLALAGLCALVAAAIPFAALRAQESVPKVELSGSVFDPSGGVVANAAVLLKNQNGRNQETVRANVAGQYHFSSVAAGKYDVEVRVPGFALYHQTGLDLTAPTSHADFILNVGSVSETVDVVGKGPRPAPAATAGPPRRIRVGGNVQAAKMLHQTKPVYPADAQAAGIEGSVILRAVISKDGTPLNLVALSNSSDPELVAAAIDAVKQWRYQPTLLNGQPVEVVTTVTVNFRLEH